MEGKLFERLASEEEAEARKLAEVEAEIAVLEARRTEIGERQRDLATTRRTLESLAGKNDAAGAPAAPRVEVPVVPPGAAGRVPALASRSSGPSRLSWEDGRDRILSLLGSSGAAMKSREVARAIGEDTSTPARVETTRGRLKRLVRQGYLVEDEEARFSIARANGTPRMGEGAAFRE